MVERIEGLEEKVEERVVDVVVRGVVVVGDGVVEEKVDGTPDSVDLVEIDEDDISNIHNTLKI